tara:strand:- start:489 stop:731 length:243 start_codon:yes stop_codon:yes gene_type:complete
MVDADVAVEQYSADGGNTNDVRMSLACGMDEGVEVCLGLSMSIKLLILRSSSDNPSSKSSAGLSAGLSAVLSKLASGATV